MGRDSILWNESDFPGLSEEGRAILHTLCQHPAAPRYRNRSGHRLLPSELPALRDFTRHVQLNQPASVAGTSPDWLNDHVADVYARVPAFRERGAYSGCWLDIPTTSRADLSRDITRFVPDDLSLERLILFSTSGTSGHPLTLPSHPVVAARYLAFHRKALGYFGIELQAGTGDVSVVLLGFQQRCFTYVSVNPLMQDAGLAKINLHPDDWTEPDDRARYLDAMAPELLTGDPLSLYELALLPLQHRPRALLSTSMAMSEGLRGLLEQRFACPLLDIYSMNECGPIAVYLPALAGHLLLQPRLWVEILNQDGCPVPEGESGEIVLSGGFNDYLPLLRYRTGDHAALIMSPMGPLLRGLQGRPPVRFCSADGRWFNNVDISHCLARFTLPQYSLHQCADASLDLRLPESHCDQAPQLCAALEARLGILPIRVLPLQSQDKVIQYTSDFPDPRRDQD